MRKMAQVEVRNEIVEAPAVHVAQRTGSEKPLLVKNAWSLAVNTNARGQSRHASCLS
jgi:hypothetical protein